MDNKNIYVTMPTLAPLEEVNELMKGIWVSGIMTHNGPLVQRFEKECADFLGVPNLVSCTNGTIGLQMAIRALRLKGEISPPLSLSLQPSILSFGKVALPFLLILIRRPLTSTQRRLKRRLLTIRLVLCQFMSLEIAAI